MKKKEIQALFYKALSTMEMSSISVHFGKDVAEREKSRRQEKRKADLLEHYNGKEPHDFLQYDSETCIGAADGGDDDGDILYTGRTTELMSGSFPVRILIVPTTKKKDVLRLLKKMTRAIKENYEAEAEQVEIVCGKDIPF